ncbi:MAG: hypothetical protein IPL96_17610 [Holophagaceae bacterium]|nr:hypothetical protein [Holophagaceae bacterium]
MCSFDLAGAEENFPAKKFKEAFGARPRQQHQLHPARRRILRPQSIHQAIHLCGAHRIGHGVRLIESGELLNYVNDHRIPIEVCPSSNVQTKAVKRSRRPPHPPLLRPGPAGDGQPTTASRYQHERVGTSPSTRSSASFSTRLKEITIWASRACSYFLPTPSSAPCWRR